MQQETPSSSHGDSNTFQDESPTGDAGAEFGFGAGLDAGVDERPATRRKKAARKTTRKRSASGSTSAKKTPKSREDASGDESPGASSTADAEGSAPRTRRRRAAKPTDAETSDSTASEAGAESEEGAPKARAPRRKKAAARSRSTKKKDPEARDEDSVDSEDRSPRGESDQESARDDGGAGDRRPRRRTRRKSTDPSGAGQDEADEGSPARARRSGASDDEESDSEDGRGRRRGRRGGRRRRGAASEEGVEPSEKDDGDARDRESGDRESRGRDGDADEERPSRSRSRGGRKRSSAKDEDGRRGPDSDSGEEESPTRSKRGRRRKTGRSNADADPKREDAPRGESSDRDDDENRTGKRRRRGLRGGRRRSTPERDESAPVEIEAIPWDDDDLPALEEDSGDRDRGSRSDKKGRGGSKSKEEDGRAKKGKKASRKAKKIDDDEPEAPVDPPSDNIILVNAKDNDELRVAVVEDELITDFQMTVHRHKTLVNDIYRGRVVNLEPAIGAAFVDFGQGRNGFLHTSDVLSVYGEKDWSLEKLLTTRIDPDEWDGESSQPDVSIDLDDSDDNGSPPKGDDEGSSRKKGRSKKSRASKAKTGRGKPDGKKGGKVRRHARPRLPITDLLKKGQSVVVQITKDAIGDKGPTLTTYISIPGRYLVLMPSMARTGVSRKIEDERERRRLKRILKGMKIPDGMGVIVRTAGVGQTKKDLQRDLDYLLLMWEDFDNRLTLGRGPLSLYEESDVGLRTMRDLFTPGTEKVVVDDEELHGRMVEFTKKLMPEQVDRIVLHDQKRPLFHTYGIEQDFERIFSRRVELPSGGSIVFDQAEALVAIDVNSGKTRSDGFDFEEIALKTNLEAVPEIARQIRLRDLGGIIVCDFIDMMRTANRRAVEKCLRDSLSGDRARAKLGRISQFGLLEMTRQRLGAGMVKMLFQNCVHCRGTGVERTPESRAIAILRRLGSALTLKGFSKIEVRAHPDSIETIHRNFQADLDELKTRHDRTLVFTEVPDQLEDSVFRYLRADGREVRPGGRRKR